MVNQGSLTSETNQDTSNHTPRSNEPAPWLEPPIQVIIPNPTERKVDPEGAAIEATNRIAYLNESRTPTISIYTEASSQANGTTAWACFIKEKDEEIRGRNPNHSSITLAELHVVKAALIWISRQIIHGRVTIHSDSMGALTTITTTNVHINPQVITEILPLHMPTTTIRTYQTPSID